MPHSAEDGWKAEYEAHVAEWRARSAEQRERAEAERARWEAMRAEEERRAKEEKEGSGSGSAEKLSESAVSEWESVKAATEGRASPSPADVRDLVTGEHQGHRHAVRSIMLWHRGVSRY